MKRILLLDCNNFYVSCERVFNPTLHNKPVVILSSNDGCIISRSQEAKALGIPMGARVFDYKDLIQRNNVITLSSNFTLYADMSARVMQTVKTYATEYEVYSIDEMFFELPPMNEHAYTIYAQFLRALVKKNVGIPISIGIGSTKTLAKIANKYAKQHEIHHGVFDITLLDPTSLTQFLSAIPTQDIWGIGRRYSKKLANYGIKTAADLCTGDDMLIRKLCTIQGLKTAHELRGIPCINLDTLCPERESLTVSRTFGRAVTSVQEVGQALAWHATLAGEKVRKQGMVASYLIVFFRSTPPTEYTLTTTSTCAALTIPTSYTPHLIQAAHQALQSIKKQGVFYRSCGVTLGGFFPDSTQQESLFHPVINPEQTNLMSTLDQINARWGKHTLTFAASGTTRPWQAKARKKSPCFTTQWHELMTAS